MVCKARIIGLIVLVYLVLSASVSYAQISLPDHADMPCCQDAEFSMPSPADDCDQCSVLTVCGACVWSDVNPIYWTCVSLGVSPALGAPPRFADFFPPLELKPPRWIVSA